MRSSLCVVACQLCTQWQQRAAIVQLSLVAPGLRSISDEAGWRNKHQPWRLKSESFGQTPAKTAQMLSVPKPEPSSTSAHLPLSHKLQALQNQMSECQESKAANELLQQHSKPQADGKDGADERSRGDGHAEQKLDNGACIGSKEDDLNSPPPFVQLALQEKTTQQPAGATKIKVVGIGGAGSNTIFSLPEALAPMEVKRAVESVAIRTLPSSSVG